MVADVSLLQRPVEPHALRIAPSPQAPHVEHLTFADFPAFQGHIQRFLPQWNAQVQQALRLIALNGIVDPLNGTVVPAEALSISGSNYRETLEYNGLLARHRAVLLIVQELLAAGQIGRAHV